MVAHSKPSLPPILDVNAQLSGYTVTERLAGDQIIDELLAADSAGGVVVLRVPLDVTGAHALRTEASLAQLHLHDGIVQSVGVIEIGGWPVQVLEHIDGTGLDALALVSGGLPAEAVSRLGRQVALALMDLHGKEPIAIHGALSAERVIVDINGNARLRDLGRLRPTQIGRGLSPERRARSQAPSVADDLYALGVLLIEASLGHPLEIGDVRLLDGVLPPRLVDALAVLIGPVEARLTNASAAVRMFSELERLFGDGHRALRIAMERARSGGVVQDSVAAPITVPDGAPVAEPRIVARVESYQSYPEPPTMPAAPPMAVAAPPAFVSADPIEMARFDAEANAILAAPLVSLAVRDEHASLHASLENLRLDAPTLDPDATDDALDRTANAPYIPYAGDDDRTLPPIFTPDANDRAAALANESAALASASDGALSNEDAHPGAPSNEALATPNARASSSKPAKHAKSPSAQFEAGTPRVPSNQKVLVVATACFLVLATAVTAPMWLSRLPSLPSLPSFSLPSLPAFAQFTAEASAAQSNDAPADVTSSFSLPSFSLPSVSLPSFSLPSLPSFSLPSLDIKLPTLASVLGDDVEAPLEQGPDLDALAAALTAAALAADAPIEAAVDAPVAVAPVVVAPALVFDEMPEGDAAFSVKTSKAKKPAKAKPVIAKPVIAKPVIAKPVIAKPVVEAPVVTKSRGKLVVAGVSSSVRASAEASLRSCTVSESIVGVVHVAGGAVTRVSTEPKNACVERTLKRTLRGLTDSEPFELVLPE